MLKHHNILRLCLTLTLFMAGFSDAHAATIIIDSFDGMNQQAPPDNEIAVSNAIGGFRLLAQVAGENQITVSTPEGLPGVLVTGSRDVGGTTKAEWNGDGGLGGIDLTAGGDRFQLSGVVFLDTASALETLTLRVTDTVDGVSTFTETYENICNTSPNCVFGETSPVGTYEIPFSSLSGGANLASVDIIALEFFTEPFVSNVAIEIGSFQVVPEPSTGLLLGSALLGLLGLARRKQAA